MVALTQQGRGQTDHGDGWKPWAIIGARETMVIIHGVVRHYCPCPCHRARLRNACSNMHWLPRARARTHTHQVLIIIRSQSRFFLKIVGTLC